MMRSALSFLFVILSTVFVSAGNSVIPEVLRVMTNGPSDDEAMVARKKGSLSEADYQKIIQGSSEDYFHDMDYGVTNPANRDKLVQSLEPFVPGITGDQAVNRMARGRNNWMVWTGGNDRFWTYLGRATFGGLDFIKTISSGGGLPASRSNRWQTLGLVNEPCFSQATGPNPDRWGLLLDKRSSGCAADPFEDATKYPGVKVGARGTVLNYKGQKKLLEVGSYYGYATGVIGFRLFPNPDFDQAAADKWDPVKYYNDPAYYNDPSTIRPYRVGMACALCHVGPNPSRPPVDFNNPLWSNLNSNPGAQYFWVDRIFFWDWKKGQNSFVYQLLHTSRPGSLDTSLISSDQINNPRTMNAVYNLAARLKVAKDFNAFESLTTEGEKLNQQFNKLGTNILPNQSPLRANANAAGVLSPRVLKDGSDSVGALGALNRVFVNIGLFSEEWLRHFIPLIGGSQITPFPIAKAKQNSVYWQATEAQTPDLALFFLGSAEPDKLANAPGHEMYLKDINGPEVSLGKKVFAENCAGCHSSKLPEKAYSFFNNESCVGAGYLSCWNQYSQYAQSDEFKSEMNKLVMQNDFLENNYLSTDLRVPVTATDGQLCSPIATNAIKNNIWDNFSSTSYKNLPSVGQFTVNYPVDSSNSMRHQVQAVPNGGRGFLRPPSLISVWSTAPFLQNNAIGKFDLNGTVAGRMASFNDSIDKLLNPEKRGNSGDYDQQAAHRTVQYTTSFGDVLPGTIDITTQESYIIIPRGYINECLFNLTEKSFASNPKNKKGAVAKNKSGKVRDVAGLLPGFPKIPNLSDFNPCSPMANSDDKLSLGPIPAGVPINLISNINMAVNLGVTATTGAAIARMTSALLHINNSKLSGTAARDYFMSAAAPALLDASKCKDFVVDRGHYFGTRFSKSKKGLSSVEKSGLIEFLKHM